MVVSGDATHSPSSIRERVVRDVKAMLEPCGSATSERDTCPWRGGGGGGDRLVGEGVERATRDFLGNCTLVVACPVVRRGWLG